MSNSVLISSRRHISNYDPHTQKLSRITGASIEGFSDGDLKVARFNRLNELIRLTESVSVITDEYNNRLRVVNTALDSVTSICVGDEGTADGPIESCCLNGPLSLLVRNKVLYVGQWKAIRALPCEYNIHVKT